MEGKSAAAPGDETSPAFGRWVSAPHPADNETFVTASRVRGQNCSGRLDIFAEFSALQADTIL
jgi:hypothetical protein